MKRNTTPATIEYGEMSLIGQEYLDLLQKLEDLQAENKRLQARIETLEARLNWMRDPP